MKITVLEGNARSELAFTEGETILDVLQRGEIRSSHAPCGGKGVCKKCNVYVRSENFCGTCLSCTTKAADGMIVEVSPVVRLSFAEDSIASVYPPTPGQAGYAVACDIGTVTIVCQLLRLDSGEQIASVSGSNSQSIFGANILSRLQAAAEGHAEDLTELLRHQINGYLRSMCREVEISPEEIKMIAVSGNTMMEHFFAGLNPAEHGIAPFLPISDFGEMLDAKTLGLCFDGSAFLCPCASGFIGGDSTAGLLSVNMISAEAPVLFADLGANSELILGSGGRIVACTADAGAAFKASLLDKGMTASAGAISGVEFRDGHLVLQVLGDAKPMGVCGSGLIDALGMMYRMNALDEMGRIALPEEADSAIAPMIGTVDGEKVFFLTENRKVYITQADISKFQLAKAAISAGIRILAEELGIRVEDISKVYLAGGFGTFVRPGNAAAIGLIPSELLGKAEMVGNAAVAGAASAALSEEARAHLQRIRSSIHYVDLPTHPSFADAYVEGMLFE